MERLIDKACNETGFDRVDLRRRNLIGPADMPYDNGLGLTYDCGAFEDVMDKALILADVSGYDDRRLVSLNSGKRRGIGVCNVLEQTGRPSIEGATLRLDTEGGITLASVMPPSVSSRKVAPSILGRPVCSRTLQTPIPRRLPEFNETKRRSS